VLPVNEFWQTPWIPLDRQLQQVVDGLGIVVVSPPMDPRMLLAWFEDKRR